MSLHLYSEIPGLTIKAGHTNIKWLKDVIKSEQGDVGNINIILVTDKELLRLNKSFLNRDYLTDVISFDYSEGKTISGDIYISYDRVKENAKDLNLDVESELHRVMVHGALHLLGYNDVSPSDKKLMTSKEDHYLARRPSA